MAYTQLISTEYIFTHNIIPDDVDANLIGKFIRQAQGTNIKDVLGYNLYTKLMNDYATTGTWTGSYLELMNAYVKPCLSEWTLFHAFPFISNRITNKSIVKKDSENSTPSPTEDVKWLRELVKDEAERLSEEIRNYIINATSAEIPEYFGQIGINRQTPRANNYSTGIHLEGRNNAWVNSLPIDYGNDPNNWPDNRYKNY